MRTVRTSNTTARAYIMQHRKNNLTPLSQDGLDADPMLCRLSNSTKAYPSRGGDAKPPVQSLDSGAAEQCARCHGTIHQSIRDGLMPSSDSFREDPRLSRVKSYVDTHLADRITLAKAAKVANQSSSYFSRYFRRKVGVTFRDWLRHRRVDRAKRLLRYSSRPVTSIGLMCGFGSLSTFERAFRRSEGVSPRTYRNKYSTGSAAKIGQNLHATRH